MKKDANGMNHSEKTGQFVRKGGADQAIASAVKEAFTTLESGNDPEKAVKSLISKASGTYSASLPVVGTRNVQVFNSLGEKLTSRISSTRRRDGEAAAKELARNYIMVIANFEEILDKGKKSEWQSDFHNNGLEKQGRVINPDTDRAVLYVTAEIQKIFGEKMEVELDLMMERYLDPKIYSIVSSDDVFRWNAGREHKKKDVPHPNPKRLFKDEQPCVEIVDIQIKKKRS